MKIVVTGALGHIGSKLIRELPVLFPNTELVMIDNISTMRYCSLFNLPKAARYVFVEGDVLKIDLPPLLDGANVVVHLSAITDATGSFNNKEQVEHVNYNGTSKVALACEKVGAAMLHLSSTSVYGTQKDVVDEDCSIEELKPQSPYAATKLKEESLLQKLHAEKKARYIICRFGTICGTSPGMRFHTAVNKFCWQAIMGQPLTVWRTALDQKRPYLALNDAVRAIGFIIQNNLFDGNIYNVLTDNMTVREIVALIEKHLGREVKSHYVDNAIMNQLSYEVLSRKFQDKGFKFRGSIEESIKETIELLNIPV
jgi:UDP-glucose 4-epimerase